MKAKRAKTLPYQVVGMTIAGKQFNRRYKTPKAAEAAMDKLVFGSATALFAVSGKDMLADLRARAALSKVEST